ncbi:MAG: hypothetical protein JRI23_22980 [Deltaproteobacteria bacterium]|jgi:hypothetical protein|nr:hypothetical protein [Deltaproteobacteria bacterium]MBW2534836.1 hypothetical protein [Deltaproteobacteria bacterium]
MRIAGGIVRWWWLVVVLVLAACEQGGKGAPDAGGAPLRPVWAKGKLTLEGAVGDMTYAVSDGDSKNGPLVIEAYFSGFPSGTKLSIGSSTATASDSGEYRAKEDVRALVGKLPVKDVVLGAIDLGISVGIAMPGREPLTTLLPPIDIRPSLARAFGELPDQGWRFPDEPKYDGKARSVVVIGPASAKRQMRVLGPAEKIWDVDWVAIETRAETPRTKRCGGYHRRIDVRLKMYDSTIEVRDRRLGNSIREHDVKAPDKCSKNPLLNPDGSTIATIDPKDVDQWLSKELGLKPSKR